MTPKNGWMDLAMFLFFAKRKKKNKKKIGDQNLYQIFFRVNYWFHFASRQKYKNIWKLEFIIKLMKKKTCSSLFPIREKKNTRTYIYIYCSIITTCFVR